MVEWLFTSSLADFATRVFGAYWVAYCITSAAVFDRPRDWVIYRLEDRRTGWSYWLLDLLACVVCTGFWVAAASSFLPARVVGVFGVAGAVAAWVNQRG